MVRWKVGQMGQVRRGGNCELWIGHELQARASGEIAYKYGFRKNYATGMNEYTKYGVVPTVGGHYDHGHLGLSNINIEIVSHLNIKK